MKFHEPSSTLNSFEKKEFFQRQLFQIQIHETNQPLDQINAKPIKHINFKDNEKDDLSRYFTIFILIFV